MVFTLQKAVQEVESRNEVEVTSPPRPVCFEDALEQSGFGRYNAGLLGACCLLILAMYLDIFGFSIVLPAAACDLRLSTQQQALLSAVPLIGVMCMSYVWGLTADTLGRRATLLYAMAAGFILNMAASMASGYTTLCVLKFFSASFTASANAAGFVLVGEMTPRAHRNRFMFLMASATMLTQLIISLCALPILPLSFRVEVPLLGVEYRPWRLLMQVLSLPGALGVLALLFVTESPKFLLSRGREQEAIQAMKKVYRINTGRCEDTYELEALYLEETKVAPQEKDCSVLRRIWEQTAPLFKPPLLKHSLMIYYILLTAYMTSTGYTMWVPTLTNMYFDGGDYEGMTFCEVASGAAAAKAAGNSTTSEDCDSVVQPQTLYYVMMYSGASGTLNVMLSFLVGFVGRKSTTLGVFGVCTLCGLALNLSTAPVLSIVLFYCFIYVCLVLAGINSYIVELYPTHLRGMATCLSVVVARGSGFFSVNIIARMLAEHCQPTVYAFIALVASGGLVSFLLPSDNNNNKTKQQHKENNTP